MAEVVSMPKLGFDMAEGKLVRWVKSEGEAVKKGEVLAEIETDKATVEVEALVGGVVRKHLIPEDTAVPVGEPIAVIGSADEKIDLDALLRSAGPATAAAEPAAVTPPAAPAPSPSVVTTLKDDGADGNLPAGARVSPLARRLAEENDLDLRRITGSGPQGRIVASDVRQAIESSGARPSGAPAYTMRQAQPAERIPLVKLRAAIGRRMTAAKQQIPHFYVTSDVDAEPMMSMRAQINASLPDDQKTSINDYVVKAAALALHDLPALNASLDGDTIVRHGEINVGVAVALEDGLITMVVRQADMKPLLTVSQDIRALAGRARSGKVRPDDVEGSTFTISNLGMFDVDHFIAIINPPEAAILAVGSVRDVPIVRNGQIVPGKRMQVTLSADHRVTDGAEGARWLQIFRGLIEQPMRLVMDELVGGPR
jgi:pyruvate dehydrogenase E2 component (dihydrolipoyllysine-residue acetyltransferase)